MACKCGLAKTDPPPPPHPVTRRGRKVDIKFFGILENPSPESRTEEGSVLDTRERAIKKPRADQARGF